MSLISPLRRPLADPLGRPLSGGGLPWEGGGGAASIPPANTVAPAITSDGAVIGVGETLTTTNGTWTGSPAPTYTYQWQRGATFGGGGAWANISAATASTYAVVSADVGYSLKCVVTATNAAGSAAASSNTLIYLHATDLPYSAIGMLTTNGAVADGITTAAGTVSRWEAKWGGKAANVVLDAPAGTNEPAWNATGGPGGTRGLVTFDNVDNVLRDAAVTAWGFTVGAAQLDVVGFIAAAEATNSDVIIRWIPGDTNALTGDTAAKMRGVTGGVGGGSSLSTTTITATHRQMTFSMVSGASGTQSLLVNNVAEDTDAITHAAWADGGSVAMGAAISGAAPTALSCIGWAVTFTQAASAALSVAQRANLRAFFQNGTGVA